MQITALFDSTGKIHALFKPSAEANAPVLQFQPAAGHRVEQLEVPSGLHQLGIGQLHRAVHVDLSGSKPRLVEAPRK